MLNRISTLSLSAVVMASLVASCASSDNRTEQEKSTGILDTLPKAEKSKPKPKPYMAKIDDWVIKPYDCGPNGYPKTCAKFGNRLGELNRLRVVAAKTAGRDRSCKEVTSAEVSYRSTYSNMQFFVDCEDQSGGFKRFRFHESELKSGSAVAVSEEDKAFTKSQAGSLCKELITRSVTHPSTLGVNTFDFGYRKFKPLGNVKVYMDFKAKNAFNLELKYTATCTFQPGNPNGEIVIKERASS